MCGICVSHTINILFLFFQDKIRLLHDDLESERELRQRVRYDTIIYLCFAFIDCFGCARIE